MATSKNARTLSQKYCQKLINGTTKKPVALKSELLVPPEPLTKTRWPEVFDHYYHHLVRWNRIRRKPKQLSLPFDIFHFGFDFWKPEPTTKQTQTQSWLNDWLGAKTKTGGKKHTADINLANKMQLSTGTGEMFVCLLCAVKFTY